MKRPLPIIISVLLLIFSLARWADRCNKREKKLKAMEFRQWVSKIDSRSDSVMAYRFFATDTIGWMVDHKKGFDLSLDSAISHYRDIYMQDEKRYKVYLKVLYEYKKLSYVYGSWIKTCRINEDPSKMEKDFKMLTYNEVLQMQQIRLFEISKFNVDLIMID